MATTPKGIYYPNDYNEIADIPEDMKKMAESIDEVFEDTDSDLSDIKEEQTTQNNRLNSLEVDNTTNKSDILTNKQEINNIKTEQTTQNNRLNNLETDNTTNKENISANTQEINNIKQEQTEQNTNISTNATNIESLQEENENLKKIVSQLPQVTGQGTEVTLENTIEAPFTKFDVEGNNTQETTEGRQLLKYPYAESSKTHNGITFTIHNDGSVTVNGTSTGTAALSLIIYNAEIENGNYTAKLTNGISGNVYLYIGGGNSGISGSGNVFKNIEVTNNTFGNFLIQIPNGKTFNNLTVYPMLVKGTYTEQTMPEFEKYTGGIASPNPNYEQPILSAGDNENYLKEEWEQGAYSGSNGVGKIDSNQYVRSKEFSTIEPNKEYTSKCVVNGVEHTQGNIFFYKEDESFISSITNISSTFTTPENAKKVKYNVFKSSGITPEDVDYAKLEKGNKATPYSPYGMGSINEKIQTRNLWSSVWEQGYINANGVNENNSDLIRTKDYIYFEPEQHYAIKRSIFNSYTNVRGYDINKKFIGAGENVINLYQGNTANNPMQPTIQTCVIATKPGVYYLRFNDASNNLSTEYMMVKGDTPTDYVPHKEQDYSIFVQQPMRSIGDVRDCFVKKSDGWYERHWIGEVVLNGTENIARELISNNVYKFYINNIENVDYGDVNYVPQILCNKLIAVARTPMYLNTQGISSGNDNLQIYTDETKNMTVPEFKTWLENNNLIVNYLRTIPIDLPCTEEQIQQIENKPSTYKDFTIIQSEDETKAYLEVAGIYDLNKLITRTEVLESES